MGLAPHVTNSVPAPLSPERSSLVEPALYPRDTTVTSQTTPHCWSCQRTEDQIRSTYRSGAKLSTSSRPYGPPLTDEERVRLDDAVDCLGHDRTEEDREFQGLAFQDQAASSRLKTVLCRECTAMDYDRTESYSGTYWLPE